MDKRQTHKIILLNWIVVAMITLSPLLGTSQQVDKSDSTAVTDLKTEKVDVIKAFEVQLADASMLKINPRQPQLIKIDKQYDYSVTIIPYDISYPDPVIRPLAMRKDDPEEIYNSRIKAGYGNVKNIFTDLRFHKTIADIYDWNLHLNYNKADNSDEIDNQKYSSFYGHTNLGIPVFETSKVDLNLNGSINKRYFYYNGDDLENDLSENNSFREIGKFGGGVRFYNTHENISDIDYDISFDGKYTNLSDIDENEFYGILKTKLTKHSNKNLSFTLEGGGDLNSSFGDNDLIGFFDPRIKYSGPKFSLQGGFNYIYANGKSYVFPKAEALYAVNKDVLQVFAGVDQYYFRNNMNNITAINPFAVGFDTIATSLTRDFYAGLKGNIRGISYTIKGGNKDLNEQVYFNTDFQDSLRRISMGTADLQSTYISAVLSVPFGPSVEVGGSITQHFFRNIPTQELWHIPSLEMNVYGQLRLLQQKLKIRSDLFLRNSAKVETPDGIRNLENMIDLNLEIEYMPVTNFGIYAKGKNLLDKGYRRWYSYPNLGIHFEGGIMARF